MLGVFYYFVFFSDYLVMFLGKDYAGIGVIFKIMAIIPMFVALGGVFGQLGLLALGNESDKRYYKNTYFFAGGVAIIAILILVPLYLSIGASVALLLTEFVVLLLLWRKYFQKN
jgi:O-antigen/teichoic acid export membrane protein